jgi:hypothetical protein
MGRASDREDSAGAGQVALGLGRREMTSVPSAHEPEDSSGPPQGETTTGLVGGPAIGLVGGGGAAGGGGLCFK